MVNEEGQVILVPSEQIDGVFSAQSRPVFLPVSRFIEPIGNTRGHGEQMINRDRFRNFGIFQTQTIYDTRIQA